MCYALFCLRQGIKSLACFNEFYVLFYKDKIKVKLDNIYNILTPIAIAH